MEKTLIIAGAALGCTIFLGLAIMTASGVSMHDQQALLTMLAAFVTNAGLAGVAIWKSFQAKAATDDNSQKIGVVARVAVDGFSSEKTYAKQEAIKALNGTLPAPGSPESTLAHPKDESKP